MTPEDARGLLSGKEQMWNSSPLWRALETLANMKTEAQYHRNYETGRYERHTRTVGEWVKNDD